jgi:hypothetical protein
MLPYSFVTIHAVISPTITVILNPVGRFKYVTKYIFAQDAQKLYVNTSGPGWIKNYVYSSDFTKVKVTRKIGNKEKEKKE